MTTYALRFEVQTPCDMAAVETNFYDHFDGTVTEAFGRALITVYVDGHDNGVSAAKHAAMEIQKRLDVIVCRMDRDLVDASEVARRINRSRENVRQLINGERHKGNAFPTPLGAPNGKKIWEWGIVNEWLRENLPDVVDPERYLSRDETAEVDGWLVRWGTMPLDQHVRSEFFEITASQTRRPQPHNATRRASESWVTSWNVSRRVQAEALPSQTAG